MNSDSKQCVCCERFTDDGLIFTKGLIVGPEHSTSICMDCLTLGARWIVQQARDALRYEEKNPRPDWTPPEILKKGWVVKTSNVNSQWLWARDKPTWSGHFWNGNLWDLAALDTSDWPDVEPEHSLYECKGATG